MILVQISTALAIGAYVVLSRDAQHKRLDATPRESLPLRHSADHLSRREGPGRLQSAVRFSASVRGLGLRAVDDETLFARLWRKTRGTR